MLKIITSYYYYLSIILLKKSSRFRIFYYLLTINTVTIAIIVVVLFSASFNISKLHDIMGCHSGGITILGVDDRSDPGDRALKCITRLYFIKLIQNVLSDERDLK